MPKPWGENPKTFSLTRRSSGVPFSFRDPDGDGEDNAPAASLLFSDDFNDQPDWTSGQIDGYTEATDDGADLPEGWTAAAESPLWAPSEGHPDGHENSEILASNTDKTRDGEGKSYVVWRDSSQQTSWKSDGQLIKDLGQKYEELFVRFWFAFDPNWTDTGPTTKLWRAVAYDGSGSYVSFFSDGNASSLAGWNYEVSDFGVRNKIALRADPQETNYMMESPAPEDTPISVNQGEMSLNFENHIRDLDGDGSEENVIDKLFNLNTGEPIGSGGQVEHDDLYGTVWHKQEFYLKMNSSPGVKDGIFKQWLDDQLILNLQKIPWMGTDSPGGIGWRTVHLGGNTNFDVYPDEDRRQEWVAFDSIEVYDGLPEGME